MSCSMKSLALLVMWGVLDWQRNNWSAVAVAVAIFVSVAVDVSVAVAVAVAVI